MSHQIKEDPSTTLACNLYFALLGIQMILVVLRILGVIGWSWILIFVPLMALTTMPLLASLLLLLIDINEEQ